MTFDSGWSIALRSTAALLLASMSAAAQVVTPQAAGGAGTNSLSVTLSSTEGYDTNSDPDGRSPAVNGQEAAGYSSIFLANTDYSLQTRRVSIKANEVSSVRYFQPMSTVNTGMINTANHAGTAALSLRSPRTSLGLTETAVYTSSPLYGLFPRAQSLSSLDVSPIPADYNFELKNVDLYSYSTTALVTRQLTNRTAVSGGADWQRSDVTAPLTGRQVLDVYRGRGQVAHQVGRNTSISGAYIYRVGDVGFGASSVRLTEHGAEFGIDHRHPLSATRSISYAARIGGSAVSMPTTHDVSEFSPRPYNGVTAQMSLGYQFSRTWATRVAYQRGFDYLTGLSVPVTASSVNTMIGGALTRRFELAASATYNNGASALNRTSAFTTYAGQLHVSYAASRAVAVYVEQLYYFYDFGTGQPLISGVPSSVVRNGTRVGLSFRVPAIGR